MKHYKVTVNGTAYEITLEAVDAAVFKIDVFVVADGEEKASVGVTGFAGHTHYLFDDNGIIIIYQGIV